MRYDPAKHHRRSIRLKGYDYATPGAYFVTMCAKDRACAFGAVVGNEMTLSDWGRLIAEEWAALPQRFAHIALDAFVVMPNHVHGIITIVDDGRTGASRTGAVTAPPPPPNAPRPGAPRTGAVTAPPPTAPPFGTGAVTAPPFGTGAVTAPLPEPLGKIIAYFKYQTTKHINETRATPGAPVWQRNYYEHIVRHDRELNAIRRYIHDNPRRWALDRDNAANTRRLPAPRSTAEYLSDLPTE
jgi:REP element-mobilizing transposase RayT